MFRHPCSPWGCGTAISAVVLVLINGGVSGDGCKAGEPFEFRVPAGLDTPDYFRFEMPFQQGPKCGPNALYIVLRMLGIECSYSDVLKSVPLSETGSNLVDLRNSAETFGLACEVRKELSPEDIDALPKPVILHLKGAAIDKKGHHSSDHFAVIVGRDPVSPSQGYIGVDTNNGSVTRFKKTGLARSISGFALIVTDQSRAMRTPRSWGAWLPSLLWTLAVILILANATVFVISLGGNRADGDRTTLK
jgi:ABC-type bacteriocin/lantibiotic exporter with double-glycine peptidase domain